MMTNTIEKIGKVSTQSVRKCTGKNWDQWVQILEESGARHWSHRDIVAFLKKKYRLSLWWQQGVAMGYEIHLGKKIEGRNAKGEYSTVASRTFAMDTKALWKFLESEKGLAIWLKPYAKFQFKPKSVFENEFGAYGEVRTMKLYRRVRMTWQETEWMKPSIIQINFVPRPKNKCILVFQQEALANGRLRLQMKEHWRQVLDALLAAIK